MHFVWGSDPTESNHCVRGVERGLADRTHFSRLIVRLLRHHLVRQAQDRLD